MFLALVNSLTNGSVTLPVGFSGIGHLFDHAIAHGNHGDYSLLETLLDCADKLSVGGPIFLTNGYSPLGQAILSGNSKLCLMLLNSRKIDCTYATVNSHEEGPLSLAGKLGRTDLCELIFNHSQSVEGGDFLLEREIEQLLEGEIRRFLQDETNTCNTIVWCFKKGLNRHPVLGQLTQPQRLKLGSKLFPAACKHAAAGKFGLWNFMVQNRLILSDIVVGVGRNPLTYAVQHRPGLVQLLIDLGLDLNQADRLGETPLEIAVQRADVELARLLVGKGATMRPEVFGHFMLLWRRYPERLKAHAAEMERVLRDAIRRQRPAIPRQGVGF
jgi:Ankyrin repeats (3 copies)